MYKVLKTKLVQILDKKFKKSLQSSIEEATSTRKLINSEAILLSSMLTNTSGYQRCQQNRNFRHRPQTFLFGPARPRPELIYYKICTLVFLEGETKTHENFVNMGIICYLISVQSLTCWILKTKYYFQNFRQLKKFKNISNTFLKNLQFFKINLTEIIINYKNFTNFWGFLKHFLNKCKKNS